MPFAIVSKDSFSTDDAALSIQLFARPTANAHYMTFETSVGVDYVVPAGKTLIIKRVEGITDGNNAQFVLGYGTAGVADGVAAPAGWIQQSCDDYYRLSAANVRESYEANLKVPAAGYPCILTLAVAAVYKVSIIGVLQ